MISLLTVALGLLLLGCLGLAVVAAVEWLHADRRRRRLRAAALVAEIRLQRVTDQAMQQMLDVARSHQQGRPWR